MLTGILSLEDTGQGLSLAEREERDFQQAMAMSLSQDLGQQETGVTSTTTQPNFRRTEDDYSNDWAMTLFNASAHEIVISPDPKDRKRVADEPAFIRPSQEGLYLGGLLTILHSIPAAREALLLRDHTLSNYGHDPQWWNGQSIHLSKVVSVHDTHGLSGDSEDIIHESQRLMAFLDSTERAFCSVDPLARIDSLSTDLDGFASTFLERWKEGAAKAVPGNSYAKIFTSLAYKRALDMYDEPEDQEFSMLDLTVERDHGQTLYDVIDRAMWSDRIGEDLDDVWIERLSDIQTLRIEAADISADKIDAKIPATFYMDRYTGRCRDVSLKFRSRRLQIREDIKQLEVIMRRIATSNASAPKGLTSMAILEKAAAAVPAMYATHSEDMARESERLANELRSISARLEKKLSGVCPHISYATTRVLLF